MKTSKDKRLYKQAGHGTTSANKIYNCYLTGNLTATNVGIFEGWGDNVPEARKWVRVRLNIVPEARKWVRVRLDIVPEARKWVRVKLEVVFGGRR